MHLLVEERRTTDGFTRSEAVSKISHSFVAISKIRKHSKVLRTCWGLRIYSRIFSVPCFLHSFYICSKMFLRCLIDVLPITYLYLISYKEVSYLRNKDKIKVWKRTNILKQVLSNWWIAFETGNWRNFLNAVDKAKESCKTSGEELSDHFVDVTKMVKIGSGAERKQDDIMLTRYACYLIAQNGDPKKEQIAFTQSYFAIQTRKQEDL